MEKNKALKPRDAYAEALALFEETNPEPPGGISREVFQDFVMQTIARRETLKPITAPGSRMAQRRSQVDKVEAIILPRK